MIHISDSLCDSLLITMVTGGDIYFYFWKPYFKVHTAMLLISLFTVVISGDILLTLESSHCYIANSETYDFIL